jgi:hypothetical protein
MFRDTARQAKKNISLKIFRAMTGRERLDLLWSLCLAGFFDLASGYPLEKRLR